MDTTNRCTWQPLVPDARSTPRGSSLRAAGSGYTQEHVRWHFSDPNGSTCHPCPKFNLALSEEMQRERQAGTCRRLLSPESPRGPWRCGRRWSLGGHGRSGRRDEGAVRCWFRGSRPVLSLAHPASSFSGLLGSRSFSCLDSAGNSEAGRLVLSEQTW